MKNIKILLAEKIVNKVNLKVIAEPQANQLRRARTMTGSYIVMRTAFGLKNHWPLDATNTDIDRYDRDKNTAFFLAFRKRLLRRGKLIAGMRLTRVKEIDDSLSLEMWKSAVEKQQFSQQLLFNSSDLLMLKRAAENNQVWDLTRLVSAMSLKNRHSRADKRLTYATLLMLFGAAAKYTGPESYWIFTCNPEIKKFLDKLNIQYKLMAQGRISQEDSGESYFAWASAQAAYNQLKNSQPIVSKIVEKGHSSL